MVALLGLSLSGLALPSVANKVGVNLAEGTRAVGALLAAMVLAHVTYHRFGVSSRVYRVCDYLETFVLSGSIAYLIYCAGSALTFFWSLHLAQVLLTSAAGVTLLYATAVTIGPGALTAYFAANGDGVSAWMSAVSGLLGLAVYMDLARLYDERQAALRREAELRAQLARVLVEQERARISRNLHDNVATELTALVWKAREIADIVPEGQSRSELAAVGERLRAVIADLRNVVLSLRGPSLGFEELRNLLERRCRELCGPLELAFSVEGRIEDAELVHFHDDVLALCFELVRNASAHSGASRVTLELHASSKLTLEVTDNGGRLTHEAWSTSNGGLEGIRRRIAAMGGNVRLQIQQRETRIAIELPRPLRLRDG